jgi:hypothetical protein
MRLHLNSSTVLNDQFFFSLIEKYLGRILDEIKASTEKRKYKDELFKSINGRNIFVIVQTNMRTFTST